MKPGNKKAATDISQLAAQRLFSQFNFDFSFTPFAERKYRPYRIFGAFEQ
jgi:hypothetical protein